MSHLLGDLYVAIGSHKTHTHIYTGKLSGSKVIKCEQLTMATLTSVAQDQEKQNGREK